MQTTLSLTSILLAPLLAAAWAGETAAIRDDRAAEQLGWKVATKGYTFIQDKKTFIETLDITQRLGLKYIEVNQRQSFSKEDPRFTDEKSPADLREAIRQAMASRGIRPIGLGTLHPNNDEKATRSKFQYAKDLGIDLLIAEPFADAYDLVDRLSVEYSIRVAIHNHGKPKHMWDPALVVAAIAGRGPNWGACADTGHWARSGMNPVDCLKVLEGKLLSFHFKDTDKIGQGAVDVVLGTGTADVKGMLTELKRQHFSGLIALEYEPAAKGEELVEELRRGIAYIDGVARELTAEATPAR